MSRRPAPKFLVTVETPVVATHDLARWVLEVASRNQLKAEFPADRIRRCVGHRWKGAQEAPWLLRTGHGNRLRGSGGCHAAPLECRQHRPADLVNVLVTPVVRPAADRADTVAARIVHDLEHPAGAGLAELLKPEMALGDLVGALRPAEVGHHHRIA